MAAPARYESPHKQLGRLMVAARREGLDFEAFWWEAVRPGRSVVMVTSRTPPAGAVRWPTDRNDRLAWQAAIYASKEGWRRAFERERPTPAEAALALLADSIGALDEVAELRADGEGIGEHPALASAA